MADEPRHEEMNVAMYSQERIDKLASFSELNPNPIIEVDLKGVVHYMNPAALKLFPDLPAKGALHPFLADFESSVTVFTQAGKISHLRELKADDVWYEQVLYFARDDNLIRIYGHDITERKRAEEELTYSREQLRNLSLHLQSVREEERTTIAREIHDELGQVLTALKMDLSWLDKKHRGDRSLEERTKSMLSLVDFTIQTVKRISSELRPGVLDHLGLAAAIEWQAKEFEKHTGISCDVSVDPDDIALDRQHSTMIFRIFQEALTNVARHAKATKVRILLLEKHDGIALHVEDNGKGITKKQMNNPQSFGLIGIQERVHFLNGEIRIKGTRNRGTSLTIHIPREKREAQG